MLRKLDDTAHQNLREHAAREGKSVEAVLREIVHERWGRPPPDLTGLEELRRRFTEATKDDPRTVVEMLNDDREEDAQIEREKRARVEEDWRLAREARDRGEDPHL